MLLRMTINTRRKLFGYYAECAEDAKFTSIVYSSGWITETSCEFNGLELGKHYWYSVKARNLPDNTENQEKGCEFKFILLHVLLYLFVNKSGFGLVSE